MIGFAAQRLMELEVGELTGAAYEKSTACPVVFAQSFGSRSSIAKRDRCDLVFGRDGKVQIVDWICVGEHPGEMANGLLVLAARQSDEAARQLEQQALLRARLDGLRRAA